MKSDHQTHEQQECYSPGYGAELIGSYQARSINIEAAFFYPHLRPGMSLLDCGCGPGTITVGLAKAIAPGMVTGIDIESSQMEIADAHRRAQGVSNARFQTANVYELPFPDASFDGAFVHALLQHLKNPVAALREIHRVLKPGSVIGVRDDDQGGMVLAPSNTKMERVLNLLKTIMRESGGQPFVGRRHRELLRQAGFSRIHGYASVECDGTPEATTKRGDLAAALLEHMTESAVKLGLATAAEMRVLADVCRAWGRHPDAYGAIIWCEALGWKE